LRSGGEHSDPELAVEVRRGSLLLFGSGRMTLIQRLLLGFAGEHCDLERAVEVRRRRRNEKEEAGQLA